MEQSQELIGILQAISIVAKSLAAKLMQIENEKWSFVKSPIFFLLLFFKLLPYLYL